jgi:uncharacterized protein YjaZ
MVLKLLLYVLCVLCGQLLSGCAEKSQDLTIRFFRSESYTFTRAERRAIEDGSRAAIAEVRRLLPGVPAHIELTVRPGTEVTSETGETGDAMPPNGLMFTVDPSRPGGVAAITGAWLRPFLFHDIHHLVRYPAESPSSLVEHAVTEGMATAFERDFAGATPPWGAYPANVAEWAAELDRLPAETPRNHWLFRHPDGRRWIGYKVGTYWVDQAMAKTGRSAADLVTMSTTEVLSFSRRAQ